MSKNRVTNHITSAFSLVSDNFEPKRRTLAFAVFNAIGLSGIFGSFLMAGLVAPAYGWRTAFVLAAIPGFIIAALIPFVVAEPKRGKSEKIVIETVEWREGVRILARNRSCRWLILGAARTVPSCLVAEDHWDQVGWAIAEHAWRFQPVIDEVLR
jgi:MFS family permease